MKSSEEDAEAKRLQKNAYRRRWYAQLPEDRREATRQKKRQKYAEDKELSSRGDYTYSCLNTMSDDYGNVNKGITIKDTATNHDLGQTTKHAPPNDGSSKGKEKISSHSSFYVGTQTSHTNEYAQTSTQIASAGQDFPISRHGVKDATTITSNIYCQNIPVQNPDQPDHTQEWRYQQRPPARGKRKNISRGSTKPAKNILQNIASTPSMLPFVLPCKFCAAKRFYHEPAGFCCSKGEIKLISNTTPDELYNLYMSPTDKSNEFRTYIRTYNNTFAFTSFGVKFDKNLCKRNKGIYTFKIQGQLYHYINEILPTDNDPSYLQLYFYDTDNEIYNRTNKSNKLNSSIVEQLVEILKVNPYATFFRTLTNILEWSDQKIIIKADAGLDQRVFNSPSSSQVAAIWLENTESIERRGRDIIVYNHRGYTHKVEYYYGCYDPLQYLLLFPYGEPGWHQGIKRIDMQEEPLCAGQFLVDPLKMKSADEIIQKEKKVLSSAKKNARAVSCREYYCYKLQIRPDDKSILLHAGRLLQQYVVDMYVKLETSRLDYFRLNQQEIRAEVYQGLMDSIALGETRGSKVGRRIVLPASFTGGPRDMHKRN